MLLHRRGDADLSTPRDPGRGGLTPGRLQALRDLRPGSGPGGTLHVRRDPGEDRQPGRQAGQAAGQLAAARGALPPAPGLPGLGQGDGRGGELDCVAGANYPRC
jgi:hypothetical protein